MGVDGSLRGLHLGRGVSGTFLPSHGGAVAATHSTRQQNTTYMKQTRPSGIQQRSSRYRLYYEQYIVLTLSRETVSGRRHTHNRTHINSHSRQFNSWSVLKEQRESLRGAQNGQEHDREHSDILSDLPTTVIILVMSSLMSWVNHR